MPIINNIRSRQILDSRGNPTLETVVTFGNGLCTKASVPSGASTGRHEAVELRDYDRKKYHGKGVLKAVKNVQGPLSKILIHKNFNTHRQIDNALIQKDGTKNKSRMGANAILSISLATARAFANFSKKPLYKYLRKEYFPSKAGWKMPSCMMNLINGGVHAGWSTDIQEYMIVPKIKSARGQVRCGAEVFHSLEKNISGENLNTTVGDEGGFSLRLNSNEKPLQFLLKAIKSAGYMPGREVGFALDVAASEFYKKGLYSLKAEKKQGNSQIIFHIFERWLKKYPIVSIEDGLDQDDWKGWQELTLKFGKNVDLVGDDLFVTNKERLQTGIHSGVANAILIKLNQIGSLSETADTVTLAQQNGYKIAVSHRSGETNDDFISDLAVACGADYLKAGSLSRGERVAKYNRLIEIESELLSL